MKDKLFKLEMMRGFAALYVMATHLVHYLHWENGSFLEKVLLMPFHFGQEAVMLFFLISGFVIFLSTEKQRPDFFTYLSRRWLRIYPVFLLALFLAAIDIALLKSQSFSWRILFGNIFMLQDSGEKPGGWFPPFGGNGPLWSLSYEWWFYLLFYPIWRFISIHHQRFVAVGLSFFGLIGYALYPNQPCLFLAYFVVWWTGGEFARQYVAEGRVAFKSQLGNIVILFSFLSLAILALSISARHYYHWTPKEAFATGSISFRIYPIIQIRQFAAGLLIAIGALIWQKFNWTAFNTLFGIFQRIAPISYGIYALHYLFITGSFFLFLPSWGASVAAIICTFIVAWLAEIPFQKFVKRHVSWLPNQALDPARAYEKRLDKD